MKHLKKFEFYSPEFDSSQEEEEVSVPPSEDDVFGHGQKEKFPEEEDYINHRKLMSHLVDGGEDEFGERYDNVWGEYDEEDEETHDYPSQGINSFKKFHESSCPSCKCQNCECGNEKQTYEAKKQSKGVSYDKSGLKHPEKADRNKDKKISGWEGKVGKEIQKSMEKKKGESPSTKTTQSKKESQKKEEKSVEKDPNLKKK